MTTSFYQDFAFIVASKSKDGYMEMKRTKRYLEPVKEDCNPPINNNAINGSVQRTEKRGTEAKLNPIYENYVPPAHQPNLSEDFQVRLKLMVQFML